MQKQVYAGFSIILVLVWSKIQSWIDPAYLPVSSTMRRSDANLDDCRRCDRRLTTGQLKNLKDRQSVRTRERERQRDTRE